MSRLTEKEIDLIQSARAATRRAPVSADHYIQKARAMQSEATAEMLGRLSKATGLTALGHWLHDSIVGPLASAFQRRRTVQQLKRLDDHLLRDIGLERGMVETFGEELSARTVVSRRADEGPVARGQNWLRRRRTIRQLESLSDRQLADIGLVRGLIEEQVDRAMAAEAAERRGRKGPVETLTREALAYVALKIDPPMRPKVARQALTAANYDATRVMPMWLGPWLPARHRDAA